MATRSSWSTTARLYDGASSAIGSSPWNVFREADLHNSMGCPWGFTREMLDAEDDTFIGKSRELREAVFALLRSLRDTLGRIR